MLDMGFIDSIADIIEQTPARRQTLLIWMSHPLPFARLVAPALLASPLLLLPPQYGHSTCMLVTAPLVHVVLLHCTDRFIRP